MRAQRRARLRGSSAWMPCATASVELFVMLLVLAQGHQMKYGAGSGVSGSRSENRAWSCSLTPLLIVFDADG
jgi:hypothetical protein